MPANSLFIRRRPRRRECWSVTETGQGLVEYALLIALVSIVVIVILSAVGGAVSNTFENITCSLEQGEDCGLPVAQAPDDDNDDGDAPPDGDPPGDEPPGDEPPGDEPPGDEPPGDEPPGDEPPGDEPPGDDPPGGEPPGDEPPGDEPPGDDPPGDEPPGDEPPGDDVPGPQNAPPVLQEPAAQTIGEGQTLTITFTAGDPDGDPLVYGAVGLIDFMTFTDQGNGTATLRLTPGYNDARVYTINVNVSDGHGGMDAVAVTVTVTDVVLDSDGDTIPDETDNCPQNGNISQDDTDGDGIGNVCDGHYAINFGASTALTDASGVIWRPGTAASSGGSIYTVTTNSYSGVTEPTVCKTLVESRTMFGTGKDLSFSLSGLPSATYTIKLYFMETESKDGKRGTFDVKLEGTVKLNDYQPGYISGKWKTNTARAETTTASITDGTLTLLLDQVSGYTHICALEITRSS